MRICHVVHSLSANRGGPPVVVARLASEQAREGHDVRIAACSRISEQDANVMLRSLPGGDQVRVISDPLGNGPSKLIRPVWSPALSGADVIHLHEFWIPGLWAVAAGAHKRSICYVLSPHGTLGTRHLAEKRLKKMIGLQLGGYRVIHRAGFIQAFTSYEAEDIKPLVGDVPIAVIPNGIDPANFDVQLDIRGLLGPLGFPLNGRYLLFLARISSTKGVEILLEAFRRVSFDYPDVHLVFAGPDFGALASLKQLAAMYGLGTRVHFPGHLAGKVKLAALTGAYATCLVSRFEGFSMTILESLAAGTPVIASDRCNFPELREAGVGLIVRCDTQSTEHALRRILGEYGLRDRMGAAACPFVNARYSSQHVTRQVLDWYKRALNRC